MNIQDIVKSQYHASLEMLKQSVVRCPESMWDDPAHKNRFWNIAYHGLFYTDLYLRPSESDFQAWEHHRGEIHNMESDSDQPYTKDQILAYHDLVRAQVDDIVDSLDLHGESGFYWLPFSKLEVQFYSMRHLMQHTGELCERLGHEADVDVDWVGKRPE